MHQDHKYPVSVEYVGAIDNKKNSVGANKAMIVSKSGFTKSALAKCKSLGITALTYKDAITNSWANWFSMKSIIVAKKQYVLLDAELISPPEQNLNIETLNKPSQINIKEPIITIGENPTLVSIDELFKSLDVFPTLWDDIPFNGDYILDKGLNLCYY